MTTITTLVDVADIIKFVKTRNEPLGLEVELMLSDKILDVAQPDGENTYAAFAHFTNDPVLAGINGQEGNPVVATETTYFLRILRINAERVKAEEPTETEVCAFYVVDYNSLQLWDQTHNLV